MVVTIVPVRVVGDVIELGVRNQIIFREAAQWDCCTAVCDLGAARGCLLYDRELVSNAVAAVAQRSL